MRIAIIVSMLLCLAGLSRAEEASKSWFTLDANNNVTLRVDMFLTSTCPHCQKAQEFFKELQTTTPWLNLHPYIINQDKAALEMFYQFLRAQKEDDFSVPSIVFCHSRWIGFDDAGKIGKQLLKAMKYCRAQIAKTGQLTPATLQTLKQMSTASQYEANLVTNLSTTSFVPLMAAVDVFNSCAIFSMLIIFSFFMTQGSLTNQIGVGIVFLLGVAIAHYVQQAYTPFFYQNLSYLRIPALLLGVALIASMLAFLKGINIKKNGFVLGVFILALLTGFIVQVYQQTAMPNFSLIFQQWLNLQEISARRHFIYEWVYQLVYLFVIGFGAMSLVALSKYYKRWAKNLPRLEEFARYYLVIIGLVLIVSPFLLGEFLFSMLMVIIASIGSWIPWPNKKR